MEGYKTAADELVEQALGAKNVGRLDTFIFPILFLYRHFIELELKWIFLVYSDGDSPVKKSVLDKVKHNLMKIWKETKPILLRRYNARRTARRQYSKGLY